MDSQNSRTALDPFTQPILLTIPGIGRVPIPMIDLEHYVSYAVRVCINYSSQIGASLVLLVVLLLLTKAEKRWTAIFTFNLLSLLINIARNILQCVFFTGPFYNPYAFFSGDFSRVPASQYGAQVAATILTTILDATIETSLILQVKAVCATMTATKRLLVLLTSIAVALNVVGWRSALAVVNSKEILSNGSMVKYQWLVTTSMYVFTSSICFFSLIFVIKLGFAMKQRRKLGLRQFGPMQVIFIMGCQTLFIPAIFSVLEWFTTVPEFGSQVSTITAIFLPLSSMWAAQSLQTPVAGPAKAVKNSPSTRKLIGFSSLSSLFSNMTSKAPTSNASDDLDGSTLDSSPATAAFESTDEGACLEKGENHVCGTRFAETLAEYNGKEENKAGRYI